MSDQLDELERLVTKQKDIFYDNIEFNNKHKIGDYGAVFETSQLLCQETLCIWFLSRIKDLRLGKTISEDSLFKKFNIEEARKTDLHTRDHIDETIKEVNTTQVKFVDDSINNASKELMLKLAVLVVVMLVAVISVCVGVFN